jgi:two-component system chemotaxis response regulator CheB
VIRVLIVDDSPVVRRVLTTELGRYPDIEVVGTAADPYAAREEIVRLAPDVVTLDVEMPRMDGLSFLEKLMRHHPLPVIVVSSVTPRHSAAAVRALALGAVDVLCKPASASATAETGRQLAAAVRLAAGARVRRLQAPPPSVTAIAPRGAATPPPRAVAPRAGAQWARSVLAIGASTGGPPALEAVLRALPADTPGTLIVQHMPEHFTAAFAGRLDKLCAIEVREARDHDRVVPGLALIAPGGKHMVLARLAPGSYEVRVKDGPPVHHQRPAVDVLFDSVARVVGAGAVGVLLTGMGADGAKGMLAMRTAGATTIAQNEESCVVFGMPREAIRLGGADAVLPLDAVAGAAVAALCERPAAVGV